MTYLERRQTVQRLRWVGAILAIASLAFGVGVFIGVKVDAGWVPMVLIVGSFLGIIFGLGLLGAKEGVLDE